jgi:hypothetical protein
MAFVESLAALGAVSGIDKPSRRLFLKAAIDGDLHIVHLAPRRSGTSAQKSYTATSSPLDQLDLRPDFLKDIAAHLLLGLIPFEIIGMQRLADDDLRPAEPIARGRLLHLAELSRQLGYFFLEQVGDVFADGVEALQSRHLVFQQTDPNIPVRAVLRARTSRPNSHFRLPSLSDRNIDALCV